MEQNYQTDPTLMAGMAGMQGVNEQMKLASMLRAQSLQPHQQQMAGRVVVPGAGLAQGLGAMGQAYVGKNMAQQAGDQRAKLMQQYFGALGQGRPQQPSPQPGMTPMNDTMGY